jgi:hypothetical protein
MPLTRQRVLVALAVAFAAIVIVRSLSPAPGASPPPSPSSQELADIAGTITLPPELAFLQTPREVPTPNPLSSWQPVFQASGTENAQTSTFELSGNLARVRYSLTGEVSVLAVYVMPSTPAPAAFAFPDVITAGAGDGETLLSRPAGSYYLSIQAVGSGWTIRIEEESPPPIEEPPDV